jgi:hypothetical protein
MFWLGNAVKTFTFLYRIRQARYP